MGFPETWIDQIHQIDNGWRLAAFTIGGIGGICYKVLKKKLDKSQQRFAITVMILLVLVCLLPYLADILHKAPTTSVALPLPPDKLTISVVVKNEAGFLCEEKEVTVKGGNANIVFKYAPGAGVWEYAIDKSDMPADGKLKVYAETVDKKCRAEQQVNLFDSVRGTVELQLQCPHPRTFSINIADPSILRDVLATTSYTVDPLSSNKIIFTYDPDKIVYHSLTSSYEFVASCLYVHINGNAVPVSSCIIPKSLPSQHKENIVEYGRTQSQLKAIEFLQRNPHQLAIWIKNFLH